MANHAMEVVVVVRVALVVAPDERSMQDQCERLRGGIESGAAEVIDRVSPGSLFLGTSLTLKG